MLEMLESQRGVMASSRKFVVVDEDDAVRHSTAYLLTRAGHRVHSFSRGDDLVAEGVPPDADAILLDLRMPGMSGIDVLRALGRTQGMPPVIVLTGHGDVPLAVEAMKLGAAEFLEKPYPPDALLALLDSVAERRALGRTDSAEQMDAVARVSRITPRQRDVLVGIARGEPNKIIAYKLGLSTRTVEAYRAQLLEKLGVRSTAEAVRLAVLAGLAGDIRAD